MSAAPVAAVKPEHSRLSPAEFLIEGSCDFGVFYDEVRVSGKQTVFFDADGNVTKVIVRGNWVVELTNIETDRSIRLNVSGQFFFTDDRLTAHGRNLLWTSFPEPFMVLTVGNFTLDRSNGLEIARARGRIVNMCARLAG